MSSKQFESFREAWESYLTEVVPKGAGPTQLSQTEEAFYGGAAALFSLIDRIVTPGQEEPSEQELQRFASVIDEVGAFIRNRVPRQEMN